MAKDKRVEILFEPRDYKLLEEEARRRGQSVGSVVREAVSKYVAGPSGAEREAAWDRLLSGEDRFGPAMDPDELSKFIARTQYEAIAEGIPDWAPAEAESE